MTSLSLNFTLGLLEKLPSGKIKCGKNAGQRKVFMYGNTLRVVNCKQTYDIIFNKYAQLGNETYIKFVPMHIIQSSSKGVTFTS